MMIAPPGWECQPEEPPRATVICAMATSVPNFSGMVPCEVSVPRAKVMFVSCEGGVAVLGATLMAVTTPASPTLSSAHLTVRFMSRPWVRGVVVRWVAPRVFSRVRVRESESQGSVTTTVFVVELIWLVIRWGRPDQHCGRPILRRADARAIASLLERSACSRVGSGDGACQELGLPYPIARYVCLKMVPNVHRWSQ